MDRRMKCPFCNTYVHAHVIMVPYKAIDIILRGEHRTEHVRVAARVITCCGETVFADDRGLFPRGELVPQDFNGWLPAGREWIGVVPDDWDQDDY